MRRASADELARRDADAAGVKMELERRLADLVSMQAPSCRCWTPGEQQIPSRLGLLASNSQHATSCRTKRRTWNRDSRRFLSLVQAATGRVLVCLGVRGVSDLGWLGVNEFWVGWDEGIWSGGCHLGFYVRGEGVWLVGSHVDSRVEHACTHALAHVRATAQRTLPEMRKCAVREHVQ
eukprot:326242-Chlamydomonas_euryale.AAC.1